MSNPETPMDTAGPDAAVRAERTIVPCNFRSSGRMSNDSARHLRMIHESFARNLAHSLDLFLGSPLEVKMVGVEQTNSREIVTAFATASYLVPFSLAPVQGRVLARFGSVLMSPLLDLLLGGTGEAEEMSRELTDIDEELVRSVIELIGTQLERAWKVMQVALAIGSSVKPALVGQLFAAEERVILVRFEIKVATTTAPFELVLPIAFANALIRGSQTEATRRVARQVQPGLSLRDRLLDCTMETSAELSALRLSVGDLVGMKAGDVVNLHAPVNTPVRLLLAGIELFEVTPVRHGNRKTAQLDRLSHKELGERA